MQEMSPTRREDLPGKLALQVLHDGVTLGVVAGLRFHEFVQASQVSGLRARDTLQQQLYDFGLPVEFRLRHP